MRRGLSPRRERLAFACAVLAGLGGQAVSAQAAEIRWDDSKNPFVGCLAAGLDSWLEAQVNALTNGEPSSEGINDAAVAAWTNEALATCKTKAGSSGAATESRFTKYMAHWRRHLYDLVENVHQQGKPD